MNGWLVVYTRRAEKDWEKLKRSDVRDRALALLALLREDPFTSPPPYETLVGELAGACSRRINLQHRLVYEVSLERRMVKILSMWSHYE
ncbi:MAG: Txe/YoeB family addiction module toxin [Dehalococcoidia bacterium]|uniref:Txe/YoeB family addiction module toxin n=1 Tax=Candidatus Amarobacter glycogenicus TaxID=3140699 RepID=UPI001D3ED622|nr:Txe/YoeB family addiction module toxin [Dehalococcoidia bacterium]MBK9344597.1 Txe/YoeB family addiction module toxin [Dehalococcoidia bacterium]MBK9609998.1 Txe/YoeB family addiction module toxin [Dehalococcoidia bacterium]